MNSSALAEGTCHPIVAATHGLSDPRDPSWILFKAIATLARRAIDIADKGPYMRAVRAHEM